MRLLATGGICVGLTIAGCTGQGNDVAGPTEEPSPSEAPISAEDAALDAYDSMWEVVVEASHEGEPDPPELELHATGDALALMRQTLSGAAEDDASVQGEPVLSPEVIEASSETVVLQDCMDSTGWVEHTEDDDVGDSPSGLREVDATVTFDGLSWMVAELRIWESGSC